jgi:predicted TIM-barrel fold metal-dependent hydrolase
VGAAAVAQNAPIPIIDTHIHLFDPRRPQGVPWPPKDAVMYRPALPSHYRALATPLGIKGAIEVECSPWLEDNQWVLDVAAGDKVIVGTIGNLEPGTAAFAGQLERFTKNPLFRGIRYGNLWGRQLRPMLEKPEFIADLKRLASANLALDSANPTVELLQDLRRVSDLVPDLRIVMDHLPKIVVRAEESAAYDAVLRDIAQRPRLYVKISAVLSRTAAGVSRNIESYRARLDRLFETFGTDRVLYGSDWPNSDPLGTYAEVLQIVRDYFEPKGRVVAEKYFWKNSVAAYRWVRRDPSQPVVS